MVITDHLDNLEFSEKNYLTEAMNFRKKYLGRDSRCDSDVAVQIGGMTYDDAEYFWRKFI